jgi:hypothetical protein
MARRRFISLCRRWSQFTAGLSTAARNRAITSQPTKVMTCHRRKSAPSTAAMVSKAAATVRITWEVGTPTHHPCLAWTRLVPQEPPESLPARLSGVSPARRSSTGSYLWLLPSPPGVLQGVSHRPPCLYLLTDEGYAGCGCDRHSGQEVGEVDTRWVVVLHRDTRFLADEPQENPHV